MKPTYSLFNGQSNTHAGPKIYPAAADLTGKEAHLAVASNVGGKLTIDLPSAADNAVHGVIGEGGATEATIFFPAPGDCFRLKLSGACDPGEALTLKADGQVEGGGAGTAYAIAEEAGVDEQLVLARKL